MEFVESFMKFSFPDDDVFRIEEDPLIKDVEGRKACECVVLIGENESFIEAKASAPNAKTSQLKFEAFIADICNKFKDSLQLYAEIKKGEQGADAFSRLPVNLKNTAANAADYRVYLIVHGHKEEWLLGLTDALKDAFRDVVKLWKMRDSNVKVFNEQIALDMKLIVNYIPKDVLKSVKEPNGNADIEKVAQWFQEHS